MTTWYEYRGTGRTRDQMIRLPFGSLFVWCNEVVDYPKRLAVHIGRDDLIIEPWSWFERALYRGRQYPGYALDHACPHNFVYYENEWELRSIPIARPQQRDII